MTNICANLDDDKENHVIQVLKGHYPLSYLVGLSNPILHGLVNKLTQCTADILGAKTKDFGGVDGVRHVNNNNNNVERVGLLQIVSKLVDFFRENPDYLVKLNPRLSLNSKHGLKRCHSALSLDPLESPPKKQKLSILEGQPLGCSQVRVILQDFVKSKNADYKKYYMKYLKLDSSLPPVKPKQQKPIWQPNSHSHPIKFHNSPDIPISSDLGRNLMKRHAIPLNDELIQKRIEKNEWYINKAASRHEGKPFDITFSKPKRLEASHFYMFPSRNQNHRHSAIIAKERIIKDTVLIVRLVQYNFKKLTNKPTPKKLLPGPTLQVLIPNSERQIVERTLRKVKRLTQQ